MIPLETKLRHALAFVHAAIEDPTDERLRRANQHSAEVLEALGSRRVQLAVAAEVAQLTSALRTLRHVLSMLPMTLDGYLAADVVSMGTRTTKRAPLV